MALEITDTFTEPYSFSTTALPSTFSPSVIGIAGVPYLLNTSDDAYGSGRYKRQAFEVVQQRNTGSLRDTLLLPQDVWRQQCESWHMGAGQANADRENALPYRYKESFGIDPWTQWQISLLPKTRKIGAFSGKTWLTTWDGSAAAVNNETIYWYDSVANNAPVGSTVVHSGDTIIDIANTGATVTTLHASFRVYETDGPSAAPSYNVHRTITNANFIAWEKDYLILGANNKLYDATSKATNAGLIYTHPVDAFKWESAASGNSCIYVLGGTGDKSYVHRLNIKADGTGLNPAIVAATLPDGEIGYTIDSYLGFVLIGTSKGVRIATENGNSGDLTLGPIIPTTVPVRCFEGQDRFVWFGNSAIDSTYATTDDYFPTGTIPGLSRMDLSVTTTSILTPAYAPDIVAIDQTGKTVRSVITYKDKRMFTMDDVGVYIEDLPLMDAGWLKQGTMSFSVEDLKTGLYTQAKWLPLAGEIDLDIAYDSTGYVRIVELHNEDSIRSGNISLDGTQFSRIDARYVLRRSSTVTTTGPSLTRWEVRAIAVRGRASRWTLPIMNYEDIEIDGVKYTRDCLSVLDTLVSLVESGTLFSLQESGRSFLVHAKDFMWNPEKLSANGRAWQGLFTLTCEEVQ